MNTIIVLVVAVVVFILETYEMLVRMIYTHICVYTLFIINAQCF